MTAGESSTAFRTPPATPTKPSEMEFPHKGPMQPPRTALQKHCDFFDRNKDGELTPFETFTGFRALGYNLFMSFLGTFLVHFFFSWWTLDTWIPDPFFTIHIKNIHRCTHGSDSHVYDQFGEQKLEYIGTLMTTFDSEKKNGLDFRQGWQMLSQMRDANDPFGWMAAILEWGFLYVLCADENGVVSYEAIRGQYDGSLFYKIEAARKIRLREQQLQSQS